MGLQVFPTRPAVHLATVGGGLLVAGLASQQAAIIGWAGGILLALAFARVSSLVSTRRIREARLEMSWVTNEHVKTTPRGTPVQLVAELRNRDTRAVQFKGLQVFSSGALDAHVEPSEGRIPASGYLRVTIHAMPERIGRWAIHGLALRIQGTPPLFEVPLTFTNPFGVEVQPKLLSAIKLAARGGRSRRIAQVGLVGAGAGEGTILRELRDLQPGDSFRKIAWKASARRGHLVVREFDHQEQDIVWVLLDASAELWAGPSGDAPLDRGIYHATAICHQHLTRGDRVGLAVLGGELRALVSPDHGPGQSAKLVKALLQATHAYDANRNNLTEREAALRVAEHIRPLDTHIAKHGPVDMETLALRAEHLRKLAPFRHARAKGVSARDAAFRSYLLSYGIDAPARMEPERERTQQALSGLLNDLAADRPRPSIVYVCAPLQTTQTDELRASLRRLHRRHTAVRWAPSETPPAPPTNDSIKAQAASVGMTWRFRVATREATRTLRKMSVRVIPLANRPIQPPTTPTQTSPVITDSPLDSPSPAKIESP